MMPRRPTFRTLALLLAGLASSTFTACGDDNKPTALSEPAKFTLVSGDAQSGNGAALGEPLVVRITDVEGNPKSDVEVTWTASDPTSVLSATTTTTDGDGRAQITWTLGASAGQQTVTAKTPAIPGAQVVFSAKGGGVISGGLTIQGTPPVGFATLSKGTALDPIATLSRNVVQPEVSAAQVASHTAPTRRLIVEFRGADASVMGSANATANATFMRNALQPLVASHLVASPEISPVIRTARVTVPAGQSMEAAAAALRADANVESVTEDVIVPMLQPYAATPVSAAALAPGGAASFAIAGALPGPLPNDPLILNALWHYNLIDAPRAWKTQTGSNAVLVAVVDNGIRYEHPAFPTNLTKDGYNFVTAGDRLSAPANVCGPTPGPLGATTTLHENGPSADPTQPDDLSFNATSNCWTRNTAGNHGMHVAGTIGAVGNDGVGVAGINWKVNIRPVRVLDVTGSGSYFDIAQGVLYAAGLPATGAGGATVQAPSRAAIINMSLGGGATQAVLQNAIVAATNAGSLIVASAGNSQTYLPSYPAAYPEVLAVTAIGPDLSLSSYSNQSSNASLAAPGGNFRSSSSSGVVSSTWNYVTGTANYAYYQGTSMAAPHVVGVAALVLAANPGLTAAQLRARLENTAVHIGAPGRNDQYGYGIVNAYNAVTNTQGPVRATYVRVVNAATGTTVQTVQTAADGSYSVSRLPAGSYLVYGGQDEDGDKVIGMPGRKFGWFGGAGAPTPVTITTGGNASASFSVGTPVESKPHTSTTTANRLSVNTYMAGLLNINEVSYYTVVVPTPGTWYFEAGGVLGACSFGIELNVKLELLDANGAAIGTGTTCLNYGASGARAQIGVSNLPAGTYYLKVSGAATSAAGQYRVWVRDTP